MPRRSRRDRAIRNAVVSQCSNEGFALQTPTVGHMPDLLRSCGKIAPDLYERNLSSAASIASVPLVVRGLLGITDDADATDDKLQAEVLAALTSPISPKISHQALHAKSDAC